MDGLIFVVSYRIEASVSAYPCQNKREISASKKCGSRWDRSRVRGYF